MFSAAERRKAARRSFYRDSTRDKALRSAALPSIEITQFVFCGLEALAALLGELISRSIDVKIEHRHRRSKRIALSATALVRGALERTRDAAWIVFGEDAFQTRALLVR